MSLGNSNQNAMIKTEEDVVKGGTIEVLEHWGDLKLPDGKLLKNWHAVVVARKFLVLFQKNDAIVNPFSYGAFIKDPVIKRGISPLYSVLSLAHVQEDLLNRTCNLQTLSENPPLLAPEGFFDEDEIQLYPGKIIEYGDNLSPTAAFKQLTFKILRIDDKTIKFSKESSIAKEVNSSESMRTSINDWIKMQEDKRPSKIAVKLADNANLFRSINNATILSPHIDGGYFYGYLYDKYDFKLQWFNNLETMIANSGAFFLQTVKQIENYNIIIPIKIKL